LTRHTFPFLQVQPKDPNVPAPFPPVLCGRRAALLAAGAVGIAGLAACSGGSSSANTTSGADASAAGGADLAKTTDIPVGGGKIFAAAGVIVTQPTAGTFKAFSDICTHQGSPIDQVHDGVMECPLHHSEFSIKDGSVVQGPATQPLPEKTVTVSGGSISVA
jgi:nitrite reductase/ring-hydroxylating ferredoxin subunit